jgi:hypothetical protein
VDKSDIFIDIETIYSSFSSSASAKRNYRLSIILLRSKQFLALDIPGGARAAHPLLRFFILIETFLSFFLLPGGYVSLASSYSSSSPIETFSSGSLSSSQRHARHLPPLRPAPFTR